eukprot:COSAG06_NODE_402_length_16190_cov_18.069045_8_plen_210_part_00
MSMSTAEAAAHVARHSALVVAVEERAGPAVASLHSKAAKAWEQRKTEINKALGCSKQHLNSWLAGKLVLAVEAEWDTKVVAWLGAAWLEAQGLDDVGGSGGGGGSAEIDEDGWEVALDGFDSSVDIPDGPAAASASADGSSATRAAGAGGGGGGSAEMKTDGRLLQMASIRPSTSLTVHLLACLKTRPTTTSASFRPAVPSSISSASGS